ncbi:hypothetical protein ACE01N_02290 [Saccharicrinis sp. FJH2]|uniref:hypothetical protein n=1 Tax=Saccharicrinis sp. FJH65 TaxID=3344659 RepID=UPI0035F3BF5C
MKKLTLTIFIFFIVFHTYGQISFEKGYYIDNRNDSTECYIKNKDWSTNPKEFQCKLSTDDAPIILGIDSVKEFGIYDKSKYIRSEVLIDRSSHAATHISETREPIYKEETLFLKVIMEGKASLYYYNGADFYRYFYSIDNSRIVQLIYKPYKDKVANVTPDYGILLINYSYDKKNEDYKKQLLIDLHCNAISSDKINSTQYYKKDLIKIFKLYNECKDSDYKDLTKRPNPVFIALRPGIRKTSLYYNLANSALGHYVPYIYEYRFDNEISYRFGIESELTLPGNKQKWAFLIEPTYVYFNSDLRYPGNSEKLANVKYHGIELPLGFRYYFYLNQKSKIFVNAGYSFGMASFTYQLQTKTNSKYFINYFTVGAGYKYNDKLSVELRFRPTKTILEFVTSENKHDPNLTSLTIGYTIFKK